MPKLSQAEVSAREKMKSVLHIWKGEQSLDYVAQSTGVDKYKIEKWCKAAHRGAVDALRQF